MKKNRNSNKKVVTILTVIKVKCICNESRLMKLSVAVDFNIITGTEVPINNEASKDLLKEERLNIL
ncbi:MAG: hypothetical protein MTP17_02200 [Candidatus Midichloria sp.]|nr:MAG: hypothetical protein MTP17_02200 [Candidatus Midichloria sp.]